MLKAAIINDFSGFGRCSLSVALPVLSVCGVQCCSVPTAVFTNHTGYPSFKKHDLTGFLPEYITEWQKLNLKFDAIATGYLSSPEQIEFSMNFIKTFRTGAVIIIDPVMGDNGRLYNSFSPETARRMKKLAAAADILTPNLTESCILTDTPYNSTPNADFMRELLRKLADLGVPNVVITGVDGENGIIGNFIYANGEYGEYFTAKDAPTRSGTGDLFSAIIASCAVKNIDFNKSVAIAADFVKNTVDLSEKENTPTTDGALFEPLLSKLPDLLRNI
jgi:pyridoxine kinase